MRFNGLLMLRSRLWIDSKYILDIFWTDLSRDLFAIGISIHLRVSNLILASWLFPLIEFNVLNSLSPCCKFGGATGSEHWADCRSRLHSAFKFIPRQDHDSMRVWVDCHVNAVSFRQPSVLRTRHSVLSRSGSDVTWRLWSQIAYQRWHSLLIEYSCVYYIMQTRVSFVHQYFLI